MTDCSLGHAGLPVCPVWRMDSTSLVIAPGRCNITQFECWPAQRLQQVFRRHLLDNNVNCPGSVKAVLRDVKCEVGRQILFMKKSCWKHLQDAKGASSSLIGSVVRTTSAGELPLHAGQTSKDDTLNGSLNSGSDIYFGRPTEEEKVAAIRESALRSKYLRKLSEANQYGRHVRRQLLEKEEALLKCKTELSIMETEIQALVALAHEVARDGIKPGTRKINGKYIQSHLAFRLKELHERLLLQVKDVDAVRYRDVPVVWYGMAEDVQVMGSFDGWTRGVQMSPESTGSFTKFSTTLKLRPGRFEIKFLVDEQWYVSPEWPTVGEGDTVNNVIIVE